MFATKYGSNNFPFLKISKISAFRLYDSSNAILRIPIVSNELKSKTARLIKIVMKKKGISAAIWDAINATEK